ncbi:CDP-glucose 4,6-dehydratase [Hyphomicrobium sp. CS1GBMeth3]|uniref:CDP-glucose 4,6-dehydratase n=1 Tax=Hyphomicrobium sp. CS1GBMeth3 TaxID=1892845 RepID=UPI000AE5B890|nr:CDP-glucose 4,6-dehydratase [Hyphomicrobium sp. CS1GBMeth3]
MSAGSGSWRGRRVLVTGHTGFKGGWLCHWLRWLGAEVHGLALDPPTEPNLFSVARVGEALAADVRADIRDADAVLRAMRAAAPEVVFHLAAQPLVREGYRDPLGTLATNVIGTANVLEAARQTPSLRAIVVVATDKVYENQEIAAPFRETDPLGAHDPYSASKAAAEIVAASYRLSFFSKPGDARIASARSGNVIGGGDWAKDRLLPDCFAAFAAGQPARLRYPNAVRPWQHVLEPLAGYIELAERLLDDTATGVDRAWNFGPDAEGDVSVSTLAKLAAEIWGPPASVVVEPQQDQPHEAGLLRLDSTLARTALDWTPRWYLRTAVAKTVAWQKAWMSGADMSAETLKQIESYEREMLA